MSARLALCGKVILLVTAGACSGSPAKKAEKATATLRSWTAAARLTVESWAAGRVTRAYASRTLEIAGQEMETAARSLDEQIAAMRPDTAAPHAAPGKGDGAAAGAGGSTAAGAGGSAVAGAAGGGAAQASRSARAAAAHLAAARGEVGRGNRAGAAGAARLLAGDAAALEVADSTLKAAAR